MERARFELIHGKDWRERGWDWSDPDGAAPPPVEGGDRVLSPIYSHPEGLLLTMACHVRADKDSGATPVDAMTLY